MIVAFFPEKVAGAPTIIAPCLLSLVIVSCYVNLFCLIVALRGRHVVFRTINSGSTVVSRARGIADQAKLAVQAGGPTPPAPVDTKEQNVISYAAVATYSRDLVDRKTTLQVRC